ncbi:MAG: single-stranded DNA-binding protein [Chlamydiae bacterium]|nr:single-stranded DNA-binding protein [Chlamydiota bacterium]MBI3277553.1 single-stranded DNA-binding protein [Chlamydiota bacterium]
MADLNKVFLVGRLTRDPEVRYTSGGQAVADLGLATGRTYLSKTGEKKEEVCFVDVVVWGRQAETSGQYLTKGSPILVEGRLQLDSWETKEGEKRNRLKVVALRVQFLGRPPSKGTSPVSEEVGVSSKSEEGVESSDEAEDDIPF